MNNVMSLQSSKIYAFSHVDANHSLSAKYMLKDVNNPLRSLQYHGIFEQENKFFSNLNDWYIGFLILHCTTYALLNFNN